MTKLTMTDRERVLMNIAVDTAGTVHDKMKPLTGGWTLRFTFDHPAAQFIPEEMTETLDMPMKPGDIVRCKTNPNHKWGIAELVEWEKYSHYLLREIGGDALCKMGNESMDVLRFMHPDRLYTGNQHRVYKWATCKAFMPRYNPDADPYWKRCGGVQFDQETLIVWCRPHILAMEKCPEGEPKLYAQPKKFTMPWSEKTKLKDIVSAMQEQGFGDDFAYGPDEPTKGQAGYAKFTRPDILRVLESSGVEEK